jgi:hypothetical protein
MEPYANRYTCAMASSEGGVAMGWIIEADMSHVR